MKIWSRNWVIVLLYHTYLLFVMNFSKKCSEVSGQLNYNWKANSIWISFQQTPWKCRMVVHHDRWFWSIIYSAKNKGYIRFHPIYILLIIQEITQDCYFLLSFKSNLLEIQTYSTVKERQVTKGGCVIVLKPGDYLKKKYAVNAAKNSNSNAGPRRKGHRKTLKQGTVWTIEIVS